MADLHSQGRGPSQETAEEIIDRLEAQQNYIPSSTSIRREYRYVLLKEYGEYVESRGAEGPVQPPEET